MTKDDTDATIDQPDICSFCDQRDDSRSDREQFHIEVAQRGVRTRTDTTADGSICEKCGSGELRRLERGASEYRDTGALGARCPLCECKRDALPDRDQFRLKIGAADTTEAENTSVEGGICGTCWAIRFRCLTEGGSTA